MHGDRVVVRIARIERDGRAHGEIVEVLRRAHPSVVGEFRIRRRGNFVVPHDDRIRQWIEIPEGMALPARQPSADRVGARAIDGEHRRRPGRHDRHRRDPRFRRRRRPAGRPRDRDPGPPGRFRHRRRNSDPRASHSAPVSGRRSGAGSRHSRPDSRRRDRPAARFSRARHRHHRRRNRARFRRRRVGGAAGQRPLGAAGAHRRREPLRAARLAHRSRSRCCAAPASIFRIAPCRCCRWSYPPTSARCGRTKIGWCCRALLEIDPHGRRGRAGIRARRDSQRGADDVHRGPRRARRRCRRCGNGTRRWSRASS